MRQGRRAGRAERTRRSFRTAEAAALAVAALGYASFALLRLDRAGFNYDEVMFVNAALGGREPIPIWSWWGPIPVMIFPYIGALKAWLYWPIFALLPVTPWTVRVPMVVVGLATLAWTGAAAARLYNPQVAMIPVVLSSACSPFLASRSAILIRIMTCISATNRKREENLVKRNLFGASVARVLVGLVLVMIARQVEAACNLIPVAERVFPSTLGSVTSPVTAPGRTVRIRLVPLCDGSGSLLGASSSQPYWD